MLNTLKQGSIWVDKKLGTFHVMCYDFAGKVYATGNVVRPKADFVKAYVPLKSWNMIRPIVLT